jgi:hypothetical protein
MVIGPTPPGTGAKEHPGPFARKRAATHHYCVLAGEADVVRLRTKPPPA